MTKISNKKKQQLAEQLYVYDDMSQKEIAEYLDTAENTITRWKHEGKWDELKAAHTTGTDEIIRNLLAQNLMITRKAKDEDRILSAQETDAIVKNAKAIKMMSKEVNLVSVILVFKKYNKFLVELSPELAKQNTEWQRRFIHLLTGQDE